MNEYIVVEIDDKILQTARFLAEQRLLYEYPRQGYGHYQHNKHLENLINGYLGELGFLKMMTQKIKEKYISKIQILQQSYNSTLAKEIYDNIKNEKFSYEAIIGQTDKGYDFKKDNILIDIKTYGTGYVRKNSDGKYYLLSGNRQKPIEKLNLLIDQRQGKKWIDNNDIIFVQAFIELQEHKCINIIYAGYHQGLPLLNTNFPQPAYACNIQNLKSMNELFQKLGV